MLPTFVKEILAKSFTPAEMVLIETNWDRYADISFGRATKAEMKKTAKMVLSYASQPNHVSR